MTTDFHLANHGSIFLLTPITAAAHEWIAINIPEDAATFGRAIAVEPRYIENIVEGAIEDGLRFN